jgi:hypothetical protein
MQKFLRRLNELDKNKFPKTVRLLESLELIQSQRFLGDALKLIEENKVTDAIQVVKEASTAGITGRDFYEGVFDALMEKRLSSNALQVVIAASEAGVKEETFYEKTALALLDGGWAVDAKEAVVAACNAEIENEDFYTKMVDAFLKKKKLVVALKLVDSVLDETGIVIKIARESFLEVVVGQNISELPSIVEAAAKEGVEDRGFYKIAINTLMSDGRLHEAQHVVLIASGIGVSLEITADQYKAAFDALLNSRNVPEAINVVAEAAKAGIKDVEFYQHAIKETGEIQILFMAREVGVELEIKEEEYKYLLREYIKRCQNQPDDITEFIDEAMNKGVADDDFFKEAIDYLNKVNNIEMIESIVEYLADKD